MPITPTAIPMSGYEVAAVVSASGIAAAAIITSLVMAAWGPGAFFGALAALFRELRNKS